MTAFGDDKGGCGSCFGGRYEAVEEQSLKGWATQSLGATQEILANADQGTPLPAQMEDILDLCSR